MIQQDDVVETTKFDAFLYYSSDLIRLKTLLFSSEEEDDDDELSAVAAVNDALRSAGLTALMSNPVNKNKDASSCKRQRGNNSRPIKQQDSGHAKRKTRLSWELHPNLLLHELYDLPGEDVQIIPNDKGDDHLDEQGQAKTIVEE